MRVLDCEPVQTAGFQSFASKARLAELLDVVIVNYNTYDDTYKCVTHLIELGEVAPHNIHVVDNFSPVLVPESISVSGAALRHLFSFSIRTVARKLRISIAFSSILTSMWTLGWSVGN